jgi:hypothetical protein
MNKSNVDKTLVEVEELTMNSENGFLSRCLMRGQAKAAFKGYDH